MRKIDTLIIKAFFGPFTLTTLVATFVLLLQYMMKYFDDFVGKDLGADVFAELLFYFSLNMLQVALPLGVLVSSLMTFGNLGENFELTAIKSAGISLLRALRPIFFFVCFLTVVAFEFNNYVVPAANLKAYSLLYDIKHKKPALDLKEGVFYNGIPDYSIKAMEKLPDNKTLKHVLIYDHTAGTGNNRVILADSSRMYTMINDRYLKLELFEGNYYSEEPKAREQVDQLYRTKFKRMDMVFNLSSFDLKRTDVELFQNNRQMKNINELTHDMDSLENSAVEARYDYFVNSKGFFTYHMDSIELSLPKGKREQRDVLADTSEILEHASMLPMFAFQKQKPDLKQEIKLKRPKADLEKKDSLLARRKDSILNVDSRIVKESVLPIMDSSQMKLDSVQIAMDSIAESKKLENAGWELLDARIASKSHDLMQTAKNQAQNVKINVASVSTRVQNLDRDYRKYTIEKHKKYSQAVACIVMFLIGAPLGAIIKKGGMGVPVIVSIAFFLLYYIIGIICQKSATEGVMDPIWSVWIADISLLPPGLFFLRQARIDAKLFDSDFYNVWMDKMKQRFAKSSV